MNIPTKTNSAAFVLLEVLMAIALFGMAGLGLSRALNLTARAALDSQMELRMMMRLESALTEASKMTRIEEFGPIISDPDELGVYVETTVTEMQEELFTMQEDGSQGEELRDMYRIVVRAFWERNGQAGEMIAETWRYAPLYQQ